MPRDNDKNPVVSLREIAEESISSDNLREGLISSMQTQIIDDEVSDHEKIIMKKLMKIVLKLS